MKQLEFASHPGNLVLVRKFVREFLDTADFSSLDADLIVLGVDEACTNIIRYAYKHENTHLITLTCEQAEDGIHIRLRDFGEKHDPEEMKSRDLENVRPGGLGLFLMRRAFDEVNYRLEKDGTELVLIKRDQPRATA